MGLLDNLNTALQERLTSDKQLDFCATDLGTNAALFTELAGISSVHLTEAEILFSESLLVITGKASVWLLPASTPMKISIIESDNLLQFTVQNASSLNTWKFSDSFESLADTYFDNLDLSSTWLIATSYEHALTDPEGNMLSGLNFIARTTPTAALESISSLNSEIKSISLQGMITDIDGQSSVLLSATLDKPVNLNLNTSTLQLQALANNNGQTETALVKGTYAGGEYSFPVEVNIPTQLDALDQLEKTLRQRYKNSNFTFFDTDLGETIAPLFFSSVFSHQLDLTEAEITNSGGILLVTGKTSVYHLAAIQIELSIAEITKDRLDFTLKVTGLNDTWIPSASFPQTLGSFFDTLAFNSRGLIATSYPHSLAELPRPLTTGLNLYLRVSLQSGSLGVLSSLQTDVSSLDFIGIVTQNESFFNIDLQSSGLEDVLQISPVGLSPMQLSSPVVHLVSKADSNGVISNSPVILGDLKLSDQLTFEGILSIPTGISTNWELTFDQGNGINFPSVAEVIKQAAGPDALAIFPASLKVVDNLSVSDLDIQFDQDIDASTYFFTSVTLKPNQDGTPRSWEIVDSPNLAVGNLKFGLATSYFKSEDNPLPYMIIGIVSGDITIGTQTNLNVSLSIPLEGDWLLAITSDNAKLPTLNDLASFIWPQGDHSDQDLLSLLPKGLEDNKLTIILNQIQIGFNPFTPSLSLVSFDLSQEGTWEILPVFKVDNWTVSMSVDVANEYNITGMLHGFMQVGNVVRIEATLPIPAGEAGWTINLQEGTTVEFPGMGELLKLIGGSAVANGLPESFNSFGNFSLDVLTVNFNPALDPALINSFEFNLTGKEDWVVLENFFSFSDISAHLKIVRSNQSYQSTGDFNGFVNIFNIQIWLQAVKETLDDPWRFKLAVAQDIHLPGLAQLANWMLPGDMANYIPETFMPFGAGFDLTALDIDFDVSNQQLNLINFSIVNAAPWNAIPGYVSLDNTVLASKITVNNTDVSKSNLAVHIATDLTVGSATVSFTADYASTVPHWSFAAKLADQVTFSFADLISAVHLDSLFSIPTDLGLPTLTVQSLDGKMVPETGNFNINGTVIILPPHPPADDTQADWTVSFLGLQFNMFGLSAKLDFKNLSPEDPQNKNYFKANIGALLDMNTLQVTVGLQLGPAGVDNIFTGTLLVSQLDALKIDKFGDGLVAGQARATSDNPYPDNNQWSKLTPNDMKLVQYASAFLYFNQTKNQLFLYGGLADFGDAIFLSQKTGEQNNQRGYLFSFALKEDFKFTDLFSGLAPIDSFLNISNAGIAITSYTVSSAADLVQQIDGIIALNDKPGTVTNPIKQANLPAGPVNQGVHLYGRLLLTGPLFSMFTQLNAEDTSGLDVTLYAFFSTDTEPDKGSIKTIFKATFAPFSIISDLITFKGAKDAPGIQMQYTQAESAEFTMSGIIGFNVFGGEYEFMGDLLVNNDKTKFTVTTAPDTSVAIQLFPTSMPPLLVLKQLGLDVIYYFQTEERTEKYLELNVTGKVELVSTIFLSSNLYLLEGKPVLALISLTQDFSISQLIGNLVGNNQTWSADFFDITFKADTLDHHSRVYYYDKSADLTPSKINGNDFRDGYNLESTIELTFLYTITILMKINVETNVGMEAQVGLTDSIKIFILELASKQKSETGNKKYINSPTLNLSTKSGSTVFGLSTGFNFFEYPFGTAEVSIGKKTLSGGGSETKISAQLVADAEVPVFGELSVNFSYCRSEGFVISNWPPFSQAYESVQKIIDIADEVSGLMKKADPTLVCGAITSLIAEVAYQNKFTMAPTFSTEAGGSDGYSLFFVLNGKFNVLVAGHEVTSIDFPNTIRIPLPHNTSFDDMEDYIKDAIKASATSFVQSLVNNGEQWAKLAGILFAEQAAELAAQWLCEGLIDALTAEAVAASGAAVVEAGGAAAIAAGGAAAAAAISAGLGAAGSIFSSCFTAGTEVNMADGTVKMIEDVKIGDVLAGYNQINNTVLAFDHPKLGTRKLYAFNEGPYFVTAEHPFLTEKGWKAIDPVATARENPRLKVGQLLPGDVLLMENDHTLEIREIRAKDADFNTQLYNFKLSGNNTYFANHLIAHNKGSTCFTAGTQVQMADRSVKAIEDVLIGDLLAGQEGTTNEVIAFDHPLLGSRKLYAFNDGDYFVTAEHPFFTTDGWKAIDPESTVRENPSLRVGVLKEGNYLMLANGTTEKITRIKCIEADPSTQLYNFILKENHTYYANSYLVHNKGGGGGTDPNPVVPTFTSTGLSYKDGWLTASWYGASYASGYELEFYDPKGQKIGQTQSLGLTTTSGKTQISLNFNGGSYTAKLRSVRGDKKSNWATTLIAKTPDPEQVKLDYTPDTDQVSISWKETGSARFSVNLYPVADPTQGHTEVVGQSPYLQKGADLDPTGMYQVKVTAIPLPGISAVPSQTIAGSGALTKLNPVESAALKADKNHLEVSWQDAQAGVDQYLVKVMVESTPADNATVMAGSNSVNLDTSAYPAGAVEVSIVPVSKPGFVSGNPVAASGVTKLSQPASADISLYKTDGKIAASWGAVEAATSYSLILKDENGNTAFENNNIEANAQRLDIGVAELTGDGTTFFMWITASGSANYLNSSPKQSDQSVTRLAAPSSLKTSIQGDNLVSSWASVTGAAQYLVKVLDTDNADNPVASKTIDAPSTGGKPGYTFTPQDFSNILNGVYRIAVQALGAKTVIDSGITYGAAIAIPPVVVPLPDLTFADGHICANWKSNDSRVTQYILQLFNAAGESLGSPVETDKTSAQFLVSQPADNTVYTVKIKVKIGQFESAWSSGTNITIFMVDTPTQLQTGTDGVSIIAAWKAVNGIDSYSVSILNAGGEKIIPDVVVGTTQALISNDLISSGSEYNIEIRAKKSQSFSPASTSNGLSIVQPETAVFYMPQAFSDDEGTYYLGNGQTLNWGNNYRNMQPVAVEDIQEATVVALTGGGASPIPWFPFAFGLKNLQRKDGYQSGDLVTFDGFDAGLNKMLVQSTDGANGPHSWSLSGGQAVNNLHQVFRLQKWIGNDGGGNAQFGSGPINAGDTIMLLVLGHDSANTSMDSGPEAVVWKLEINPVERALLLPAVENIVIAFESPDSLNSSWNKSSLTVSYLAELWNTEGDKNPLVAKKVSDASELNPSPHTIFDLSPYLQSEASINYQVKITAENPNGFVSAVSSSNPVRQFAKAILNSVVYEPPMVTGSWDPVSGASGYSLQVSQNGSPVVTLVTHKLSDSLNVSALAPGNYDFSVQATGEPGTIPGSWSDPIVFTIPELTPNEFAKQKHDAGFTNLQTAAALHQQYPLITATEFAIAMAFAGYKKDETTLALKQEFPALSPEAFAEAMLAAFPADDPEAFAQRYFAAGVPVLSTSADLVRNFPDIDPTTFASALAKAGYGKTDVTQGLKQQFPTLSPAEFADIMVSAFPTITPEEFAGSLFQSGALPEDAASKLTKNFPYLEPETLAMAMVTGGYSQRDVTLGLKQVYPNLTPQQFAQVMKTAFP
ncbi:hypothetical protein [Negadavirga shengliensis]|uniref:Fibronectin type-III domain-containing protein n=1 Tax=Negadavirga shengliensis TaxID=1389218 RepID=A0ABV9T0B3_9BACT